MLSPGRYVLVIFLFLSTLHLIVAVPVSPLVGNTSRKKNQESPPRPATPPPNIPARPGSAVTRLSWENIEVLKELAASSEQRRLAKAVPPVHPNTPDQITKAPKSYSGSGETFAGVIKSSEHGFNDMTIQHMPKPNKPSVVSALKRPDGYTYLHSSRRGGLPTKKDQYPQHLKSPQTKNIYAACKAAYGGPHRNGGSCGELRNADAYFKDHPDANHIPQGLPWEAHGHYHWQQGTELHQSVPACSGGPNFKWGCRQFKAMAKTPEDDRLAVVNDARRHRNAEPLSELPGSAPAGTTPVEPGPSTPKAEDSTPAAKKMRKIKRSMIVSTTNNELLRLLQLRDLVHTF